MKDFVVELTHSNYHFAKVVVSAQNSNEAIIMAILRSDCLYPVMQVTIQEE